MSAHRDTLTNTNLPQGTCSSEGLAASRWAPGGIEDQNMASQQMANVKLSAGEVSATATNTLANSRWATDSTEASQASNEESDKVSQNNNNEASDQIQPPNPNLNRLRRNTTNRDIPATTTANATPRRIIGPLSEEEEAVKVENPFFDPEKHKGLGSSRWANE